MLPLATGFSSMSVNSSSIVLPNAFCSSSSVTCSECSGARLRRRPRRSHTLRRAEGEGEKRHKVEEEKRMASTRKKQKSSMHTKKNKKVPHAQRTRTPPHLHRKHVVTTGRPLTELDEGRTAALDRAHQHLPPCVAERRPQPVQRQREQRRSKVPAELKREYKT